MKKIDKTVLKDNFINRELSLLDFNARVLAQATHTNIPILERLKFLFICAQNLDEFFEIRVAGLKEKIKIKSTYRAADNLLPEEVLDKVSDKAHILVKSIYEIFNNKLLPELKKNNITFIEPGKTTAPLNAWLAKYFKEHVLPVLSPVALDPAHPFPRLVNKSLNFLVSLEGKDAFGRQVNFAIVHAPRILPRVINIPEKFITKGYRFCLLTHIIQTHVKDLFPGMSVTGCYQFRLTRNSDLIFDSERADMDDLAHTLKSKLHSREYGHVARLEIDANCPSDIVSFLCEKHDITKADVYYCPGPVNLNRYMVLLDLIEDKQFRYTPFSPQIPPDLKETNDIFSVIREKDILLHHPYHAFSPVVEFIKQAIHDPDVMVIKQTLYRTHPQSTMVRSLIEAARAGKEVTAVIELRARFSEESNIELANKLQEAGALVVYGVVGYKTHAKMTLIVRKEGNQFRRYAHLSTGNYHESTAKLYTDFGFLTYDKALTSDVQKIFQQLTGLGKVLKLEKLIHSPFFLYDTIIELINDEIKNAKTGKKAIIIAKMNGLTEPNIIAKLYEASCAGVKIELIVRGICCLIPGIKGISDNIKVVSIVGELLEHERIYYFYAGGLDKTYCSSADWMERNLHHRLEVCFPIENELLKAKVKKEGLDLYLDDNTNSWELRRNGAYQKPSTSSKKSINAQQQLLDKYSKS